MGYVPNSEIIYFNRRTTFSVNCISKKHEGKLHIHVFLNGVWWVRASRLV